MTTAKHQQKQARLQAKQGELLELIQPEMHRLADELHDGQFAPSQAEFFMFAQEGMPNRYDLHTAFGKWEQVAAACGMEVASPKHYWAKRQERKGVQPVTAVYAVRDDELLAATYRPPVKVRLADKLRAEQLCAGIADERERKRTWFSALGYPAEFVAGVL